MVPKLHAKGSSFKGAAAYLLHDKDRASSAERVDWSETRNLATDDPQVAWRVMAAIAMDQARLKEEAGVKNTGRKSAKHVLHFSLSWHESEKDGLSREEMMRAALGAIRALGAQDRQALIVAHNDEPHPHVHVLLNRVSDKDGRMLPSSMEKQKLSHWAEAYERERGEILCEQRVLNNAARARGEFTRAARDKARHLFEAERPANDDDAAKALESAQREKAAALAARQRASHARHQARQSELAQAHRRRTRAISADAERRSAIVRDHIRQQYRPLWEEQFHTDQDELGRFEERETRLLGRTRNALEAIDFAALVGGEDRRQAIRQAFDVLSSAGARLEALQRSQEERASALLARQRAAETEAARLERARGRAALEENRSRFLTERSDALFAQRMDEAAMRAAWRTHSKERQAAWAQLEKDRTPARDDEQARFEAFQQRGQQTGSPEQERLAAFMARRAREGKERSR